MTSYQGALQALHYYVLIKSDRQAFTLNYMREKSLLHILYYWFLSLMACCIRAWLCILKSALMLCWAILKWVNNLIPLLIISLSDLWPPKKLLRFMGQHNSLKTIFKLVVEIFIYSSYKQTHSPVFIQCIIYPWPWCFRSPFSIVLIYSSLSFAVVLLGMNHSHSLH